VNTVGNSSIIDNIKSLYGHSIAKELIHLNMKNEKLLAEVTAYVSNANYNMKKYTFILFINSN
jgi:DNA mismatch repair protein MLH1